MRSANTMSEVRLDILVFGATGFTGKLVVENLVRICKDEQYSNLNWGLAGRSNDKLHIFLQELKDAGVNTTGIPILVADAKDENALISITVKTKVLVNCTGPYTVLGELVVKSCIATRTHYLDISAELHFMLKTYKSFHKSAEDAEVLVIPACGYGSIPAAMGLVKLENEFEGSLSTVECYSALDIPKRLYFPGPNKTLVHYGTWASLVYELQNFREYNIMKNQTFPENIYEAENKKRSFFHKRQGKYWFPYPGPDRDVIDMSQRYLHEKHNKKPVRYDTYTTMPAFYHLILIVPAFFFYYYASFLKCFRLLLWKFPKFFTLGYMSHKGPSKRNRNDTKFSFTLTGQGTERKEPEMGLDEKPSTKTMSVKVSGVDPYTITAVALVLSSITVLKDQADMPKGGVVPIGAAFFKTALVERLNKYGLSFEMIKSIV